MKKIFFLTALLCASLMSFAIDWSSYDWIGDGAGGGAYSNKYKIALGAGQAVVNIQQPDFADKPEIYTTLPAGISSCTLGEGNYAIQGAGMVLYLDAFTAQETEVTIVHGLGTTVCTVYYVNGTLPGPDYTITVNQPASGGTIAANKTKAKAGATITLTATPADGKKLEAWIVKNAGNNDVTVTSNQFTMPSSNVTVTATFMDKPALTPATYWGQDEIVREGVHYPVLWSITRNADATLTFAVKITGDVLGIVPQLNLSGAYTNLNKGDGNNWSLNPNTEYEDGVSVTGFFFMAYNAGSKEIQWTGYKVGDSNSDPSSDPTAIDNTIASEKAIKVFENGQLIIIKNGVRYNALGVEVR